MSQSPLEGFWRTEFEEQKEEGPFYGHSGHRVAAGCCPEQEMSSENVARAHGGGTHCAPTVQRGLVLCGAGTRTRSDQLQPCLQNQNGIRVNLHNLHPLRQVYYCTMSGLHFSNLISHLPFTAETAGGLVVPVWVHALILHS